MAELRRDGGAPATFDDGQPLPKVLVFDLDYTLWPFWIDTHVMPPMKPIDNGKRAVDSSRERLEFYRDVPGILAAATSRDIPMALASRTCTPDLAESLLKILQVTGEHSGSGARSGTKPKAEAVRAWDMFANRQIYPGDKRTHLKRISKATGADFEDMLFFDDEDRNRNVETLGVCFWLVRDGVSRTEIDNGVAAWRRRRHGPAQRDGS